MLFHREILCFTSLLFAEAALADKGRVEVKACIHLDNEPTKPFKVTFTGGSANDRCMKQKGGSVTESISALGVTCASIGYVEVDSSGLCYIRHSIWGMSYSIAGTSYSGSTSSRWTTGPFNSDITLQDASPGTNVCSTPTNCDSKTVEWDNDSSSPIYIVFKPGQVGRLLQVQG